MTDHDNESYGRLGLLGEFFRSAAFRLADRRTHFLTIYQELSRLQWQPTTELHARQFRRLKALIDFCYTNIRLYRRKMQENNVRAQDIRKLEDIQRLPIVTKKDIRASFPQDIIAKGTNFRSGIRSFTSGSTQTPFYVYLDPAIRGITLATRFLFDSWARVGPVERHVDIKVFPKLRERLFLNELQISAFELSSLTVRKVFDRISSFRPVALSGHPSALSLIANFMNENSLQEKIRLKAIFPWGETLIAQHRTTLQAAFRSPILARYGAAELGGLIAQECADGCDGYHINTELGILEVVDRDGLPVSAGEKGRVIMTNLHNKLMPLVRYDLGDIAVQGEAPICARGFPLIRSVEGRVVDFVETSSGSMRPLPDFHVPPRFWPHVHQYQFVQKRPGHLQLLVVPSSTFSESIAKEILKSLRALVDDIEFEISCVSDISPERSGKRQLLRKTAGLYEQSL